MGAAQYVVIAVKIEKSTTLCLICNQIPQFQKGCLGCGGKGVLDIKKRFPVYGHDIIRNVNEEGQRNTTTKVKKSPTIEKAHMERAYVDGRQDEQLRIEEYGAITRDFIKSLISGYEPADDQKTGTGRRYDYGRSI